MSIRTALLAVALGASVSPAFAQGENEAVASESGPYGIVSQLNRMCLNVHGGGLRVGAPLIASPCQRGAHSNRFHMRPMPDGRVMLIADSPRGDLCVEAPARKGQQLRLASCRPDVDGQAWSVQRDRLQASRTGYCASVEGASLAKGSRVVSSPCVGAVSERWTVAPVR